MQGYVTVTKPQKNREALEQAIQLLEENGYPYAIQHHKNGGLVLVRDAMPDDPPAIIKYNI